MVDAHRRSPEPEPVVPVAASEAARAYAAARRAAPTWIATAPGRVNLIGEHVDYSHGFVLPMAIDRYTAIAAGPAPTGAPDTIRLASSTLDQSLSLPVDADRDAIGRLSAWGRYVFGVIRLMREAGYGCGAFDAYIASDVPLGSGLSSSAALEVAVATLIETIAGRSMDPADKARCCQRAEHEFAGVPCGLMDQAASAMALDGHALLLDCRTGQAEHVPLDDPGVCVLIANSNVRHELTDGAYARRRAQCERAAEIMGVVALRDADPTMLEAARERLDPVDYRRARHVIGEIARTVHAADDLRLRRWDRFGQRMYASHASLRDDFEVSCPELDALVDLAREIGVDGGVYGSRMTGGGFGGCTVSLVRSDCAHDVADRIARAYVQRTGIEPALFQTRPSRGAHALDVARFGFPGTSA